MKLDIGGLQGIYIVSGESGHPTKIGVSATPAERLVSSQIGNWEKLSLRDFRYVVHPKMPEGRRVEFANQVRAAAVDLEKECHAVLRDMGMGLQGEWFDITAEEAVEVLEKVSKDTGRLLIDLERITKFNIRATQFGLEVHMFKKLLEQSLEAQKLINAA